MIKNGVIAGVALFVTLFFVSNRLLTVFQNIIGIPISLLLILTVTVSCVFYAYKKTPRSYFLLYLLVALIGGPFAAFKIYERSFMLSVVPDALRVTSISYSKEECWGFGPGGNEAGIRVYPLPGQVADEISQRGIEFFDNLPPNQNQQKRDWRGIYSNWSQTPINANGRWRKPKKEKGYFDIYDYICAYGLCIDINGMVVKQATEIVNSKGNYYAFGRGGLIVVSPGNKLVLYMYNG